MHPIPRGLIYIYINHGYQPLASPWDDPPRSRSNQNISAQRGDVAARFLNAMLQTAAPRSLCAPSRIPTCALVFAAEVFFFFCKVFDGRNRVFATLYMGEVVKFLRVLGAVNFFFIK